VINVVVALDRGQGIGRKGFMPWPRLDHDMDWFRKITKNNVIIMGSATWESISCYKLPDRVNVVISKKKWHTADHCFENPIKAIQTCSKLYPDSEIFVIGGQQLYDSTLSLAKKFFVTEIDQSYNCDRFFNLDYVKQNCKKVKKLASYNDPIPYTITEYSN
jgi:dihydrofolate reductase